MIESQFAATTLARFQDLLRSEAADLIDEETITSEGRSDYAILTGTNTVNPSGDKQKRRKRATLLTWTLLNRQHLNKETSLELDGMSLFVETFD